ncbi:MAG: nickel/cobalt efflux transporter [Pseudomonadota bacterium]
MDLTAMIEGGGANPVIMFAAALLLGALHGFEPGHSKTMMAAYIIAIRGTYVQAGLLGLSAAVSHSMIVWVLAMLGLIYGDELIGERMEPYFMMVSGLLIVGIGVWVMRQSLVARKTKYTHHRHIHDEHTHSHHHHHVHDHAHLSGDAHAQAHAREIEARVASGRTTTWQTILFGLSGGLIPCPAAITVLLLCLHLGQLGLGIAMVTAFSAGLALTLVGVGLAAAYGLRYASARALGGRFEWLMAIAPYLSAMLIGSVGLAIVWSGWVHLTDHVH